MKPVNSFFRTRFGRMMINLNSLTLSLNVFFFISYAYEVICSPMSCCILSTCYYIVKDGSYGLQHTMCSESIGYLVDQGDFSSCNFHYFFFSDCTQDNNTNTNFSIIKHSSSIVKKVPVCHIVLFRQS